MIPVPDVIEARQWLEMVERTLGPADLDAAVDRLADLEDVAESLAEDEAERLIEDAEAVTTNTFTDAQGRQYVDGREVVAYEAGGGGQADPGAGPGGAAGGPGDRGAGPGGPAGDELQHGPPPPPGAGGPGLGGEVGLPGVRSARVAGVGPVLIREFAWIELGRALAYEVVNVLASRPDDGLARRLVDLVHEAMELDGQEFPMDEGLYSDAYCAALASLLEAAAREVYRDQVRFRHRIETSREGRSARGEG